MEDGRSGSVVRLRIRLAFSNYSLEQARTMIYQTFGSRSSACNSRVNIESSEILKAETLRYRICLCKML
jgi:hypothetical protein